MSDIDVMDLLGGGPKAVLKKKQQASKYSAPIEMMADFLLFISKNQLREALELSDQILAFEPSNKLILEYRAALTECVKIGKSLHFSAHLSSLCLA